jgi:hypothetical protein
MPVFSICESAAGNARFSFTRGKAECHTRRQTSCAPMNHKLRQRCNGLRALVCQYLLPDLDHAIFPAV